MRFEWHKKFYHFQWNFARVFLIFWCVLVLVIVVLNLLHAHSKEEPVPWDLLPIGVGLLAAGMAITFAMRLWFNFIAGEETFKWWYRE